MAKQKAYSWRAAYDCQDWTWWLGGPQQPLLGCSAADCPSKILSPYYQQGLKHIMLWHSPKPGGLSSQKMVVQKQFHKAFHTSLIPWTFYYPICSCTLSLHNPPPRVVYLHIQAVKMAVTKGSRAVFNLLSQSSSTLCFQRRAMHLKDLLNRTEQKFCLLN